MSLLAFINLTVVVLIIDFCKGAVQITLCDEDQRKFGKEQRYTCHCHAIPTCQFVNNGKCTSGGCMAGFKGPNCQKKEKGCSTGWFGARCNKQCHCQHYDACHQATGRCNTGCELGRHGDSCEHLNYINVAFGKNTSQTSTRSRRFPLYIDASCRWTTVFYGSELAVDGIFDPNWLHQSCAVISSGAGQSWTVHLTQNYPISQIRVFTSDDITGRFRLNGTKVYVGSEKEPRKHTCYTIGELEWNHGVIYITCQQPMTGETVTIEPPYHKYWTLIMCEVEILQCKDGYFGVACKETCHCSNNSKCHTNTGNCPTGCAPGYFGDDCQTECKDGYFGVACKETCHCSSNSKCHTNTGNCSTGCAPGYIGDDCQTECKDGYFGVSCKETCHCSNNSMCHTKTGNCPTGCARGYFGDDCQTECNCSTGCAPEHFGDDCQTAYLLVLGVAILIVSFLVIIVNLIICCSFSPLYTSLPGM